MEYTAKLFGLPEFTISVVQRNTAQNSTKLYDERLFNNVI
jgi:hypothetical protein